MTQPPQVVDTSAWIEWLSETDLGRSMKEDFPALDDCIVPTIVQLELSKWLRRECNERRHDRVMEVTAECRVTALDTDIAVLAAEYHRAHKLPTADAIIYATARRHGARLLTCDVDFKHLPGVKLYEKSRNHLAPGEPLTPSETGQQQ